MQCWLEDLVVEQAKVTTVAALTSFGFQASTIYQGRNYSVNWGGGGGGAYSCIHVLPDEFLFVVQNANI